MATERLAVGLFHVDSATEGAAGPPLVLVHGAGGQHRHWPEEVRALPGRRVVALDLPGHGGSPGAGLASVTSYAGCVLALLDALGVASAVVAGHSMGGAIALTLALQAPARVAGLVLVATGAKLRVSPALLQATADPTAIAAAAELVADWSLGSLATTALRRELVEGMKAGAPGVVHRDYRACDAFDAMARLGEIRAPALVICGDEDRLTPPKYSEFLCSRVAGARLELVPGAGHMVMREAPAQVARAIEAFLASLGAPRAE